MIPAGDVMFEYLRGLQDLRRELGCDAQDSVQEALDRIPGDHPVHRLTGTAWRCIECGQTGFLPDLILVDNGHVECPQCGGDETPVVIEDMGALI